MSVHTGFLSQQPRNIGRTFVVSLMLGLWLGLGVLAVCPHLHQLLHKDSQSVTHQCLVTQFGKSSLFDGFAGLATVVPPPVGLRLPAFIEVEVFPASDHRLSPSRAPPSVSSSITVVG